MLFCLLVECWNFLQKFEYKASPQAGGRPSILNMEFDFRVEFCTHVLQSLSLPCHVKQQRNLDFDCTICTCVVQHSTMAWDNDCRGGVEYQSDLAD